jgi:deazaflavin-dependent oxidoreductase (nitroreductase family)
MTTLTYTRRPSVLGLNRVINPLVLRLAGTRLLPLYGVIEHRGRRSGKLFHTPVVVRPTGDGFVIPMPWGEGTDWCRNVRAAGGCAIRWKGRRYTLVEPEIIDAAAARQAFPAVQWGAMRRFGIRQCLRLRAAPTP